VSRPRVLVVDDEPAMLRSMERVLASEYETAAFLSPSLALAAAATWKPELAVVDIQMPGMDGFELLDRLKERDELIQVVLVTGSVDEVDQRLIRAVRGKAFYFVTKPFDREVLLALAERALETGRLERLRRDHVRHLEQEIEDARRFQESMLPPRTAEMAGLTLRAAYEPCVEAAGDLYDFALAGERTAAVLVADVVGHGVSAAMLTSLVKSAFQRSHVDGFDPLQVVRRIHRSIHTFSPDRFVTLIAARIRTGPDPGLEVVNAGHEGGLLRLGDGSVEPLETSGPLVSPIIPDGSWHTEHRGWGPGCELLLYTDGISEAEQRGEQFGLGRLEDLLGAATPGDPRLLPGILSAVRRFVDHRPPEDDRTLVYVHSTRP